MDTSDGTPRREDILRSAVALELLRAEGKPSYDPAHRGAAAVRGCSVIVRNRHSTSRAGRGHTAPAPWFGRYHSIDRDRRKQAAPMRSSTCSAMPPWRETISHRVSSSRSSRRWWRRGKRRWSWTRPGSRWSQHMRPRVGVGIATTSRTALSPTRGRVFGSDSLETPACPIGRAGLSRPGPADPEIVCDTATSWLWVQSEANRSRPRPSRRFPAIRESGQILTRARMKEAERSKAIRDLRRHFPKRLSREFSTADQER